MNCSVCGKALTRYLQDESGNLFCSEYCFETRLPKCAFCGTRMRQWIISQSTDKKYCSDKCFSSEFPLCKACGQRMETWITADDGSCYCSDACWTTVLPRCESCHKPMREWHSSQETGRKYCSDKCFATEFPLCDSCGKPMRQWTISEESGKKYCDYTCFSVEFPHCVACDNAMQNWYAADNGNKYCSTACLATTYPLCESCLSPMTSWIEANSGLQFCCQECKETDTRCQEIADNVRPKMPAVAKGAGLATGNMGASANYADQIAFHSGRRNSASGKRIQTGHGVAAEKANHLADRFTLNNAQHVGSNNAKNGADRIVDGQSIQTKYYETGKKCINTCFFDNKTGGTFKYIDDHGSPMQIEVPKDKYNEALACMREKIREGKVPSMSDPEKANDIVRKGWFTHNQAKNIVRFGKVESMTFDAVNGVRIGVFSGGISAALAFASAIWQGKDACEAGKQAALVGIKIGGTSFITSVAVAQLGRTSVEHYLRGVTKAATSQLGPKVCAAIAQGMGRDGLRGAAASTYATKLLRGNIVSGVVVTVILSTKDVYYMLDGQVSFKQAFKSITTTGASVAGGIGGGIGGGVSGAAAGATVGATIGSFIPVVGTALGALGGFVGGWVGFFGGGVAGGTAARVITNTALGLVIEDDAIVLSRAFQSVTAELAESFVLTEEEVDTLSKNIQCMDLSKVLRKMYAASNKRSFVASYVKPILVELVASRSPIKLPTTSELLISLEDCLADVDELALAE